MLQVIQLNREARMAMNEYFFKCYLRPECGKLCGHDNLTHLMTRLAIIEGTILERIEQKHIVALRELLENLEWEPCAVTMAVGSLLRQGLIRSLERGEDVFLREAV